MKKLFLMIGIGLLMASCTEDYKDWAEPQSNPDEGSKSVAFAVAQAPAIDYATLTGDSVALFVPTVTAVDEVINSYVARLYNGEDFRDLNADSEGRVLAADLKTAVQELFGKAPEERTIDMLITAYTNVAGQSLKNQGSTKAQVKLNPRKVSTAYTLVYGGKEEPFKHIGNDEAVYDNPEFKVTFTTEGENTEWYIKDADGVKIGVVDNDLMYEYEGNLTTTDYKNGIISAESKYVLLINMESYTYVLDFAPEFEEYIWQAGDANGWGNPAEPLYCNDGSGKYYGFMYLDGEYKFRINETTWEAPDWGDNGEGGLKEFGGNLSAEAGFYLVEPNLADMVYSITPVTSISIIGTVNGAWDTDTDMTYNKTTGAWECTATLNAGEMKFRMNHDWTWNWGGNDLSNFTQGGPNYQLAEAGTYFIQLFAKCDGYAHATINKR